MHRYVDMHIALHNMFSAMEEIRICGFTYSLGD